MKPVWSMEDTTYSEKYPRYTITNGGFSFDVHILVDGSKGREQYPDGWIVRPEEVKPLAEKMLNALNSGWVGD